MRRWRRWSQRCDGGGDASAEDGLSDATVEVSIDGIRTSADETTVFWDAIKGLEFKESSFGNALIVTHLEKNALGLGAKTSKIKLPGLKKDKDQFNAVVSHYWQRHQIMRAQQQAAE